MRKVASGEIRDISSWNNSSNDLLKEAYQYACHYSAAEQSTKLKGENIEIDKTDAICTGKEIGPFKIKNCDYFAYNNEIKAGVTSISIYTDFFEEDTNLEFSIFYYKDGKKQTINVNDNIVAFNQIMKAGFYIELADFPVVPSAHIKINYKALDPKANIQPLKSTMTEVIHSEGKPWTCDEHTGANFVKKGSYTYRYTSETVSGLTYIPRNSGSPGQKTIIEYSNITSKKTTTEWTCIICGGTFTSEMWGTKPCFASDTGGNHELTPTKFKTTYSATKTTYTLHECSATKSVYVIGTKDQGWQTYKCGQYGSWTIDYSKTQHLAYVESQLNDTDVKIDLEFDLIPMFREITLFKSDIITHKLVKDAKFSGSISNIKSFYLDANRSTAPIEVTDNLYTFENLNLSNGQFTIYYVELTDINVDPVVTIRLHEVDVPAGYVGIDGEVVIQANYLTREVTIDDGHKVATGQMEEVVVDGQKAQQCMHN